MSDYKKTEFTPIKGVTSIAYAPCDASPEDLTFANPIGEPAAKSFSLEYDSEDIDVTSEDEERRSPPIKSQSIKYEQVGPAVTATGKNWKYERFGHVKKFIQTGKCSPRRLIREFIKCIEEEGGQ